MVVENTNRRCGRRIGGERGRTGDGARASARRSMDDGWGWGVVTGDVGDRPTRKDTARPVLFRFLTARSSKKGSSRGRDDR